MNWIINFPTPDNQEELVDAKLTYTDPCVLKKVMYKHLSSLGPNYTTVKNFLNTSELYNDVIHLMLVKVDFSGENNIIPITKGSDGNSALFYRTANPDVNNGAIIILDEENNVLDGEPIKGGVTNELGGD
ncbi:MAG: hypothetical protein JKY48_16170 [Flavobacteriales bacterium]|nr:hypothetical protein [Flavobacteriales bacterium]